MRSKELWLVQENHKLFCIDIVFLSITEDSGFLQKKIQDQIATWNLADQTDNYI